MNLAEDYFSKKYFPEEIFLENFENRKIDGQVLFFDRVFRRHHAINDPVNWIDPEGLYKFAPGAKGPLTPGLDSALQCFETCSGTSVTVTSAVRSESKGPHGSGNACDLGRNANPDLGRGTAEQCYQKCFNPSASFGQEENNNPNIGGTHFHFQNQPGRGGANGFRPGIAPYQP